MLENDFEVLNEPLFSLTTFFDEFAMNNCKSLQASHHFGLDSEEDYYEI